MSICHGGFLCVDILCRSYSFFSFYIGLRMHLFCAYILSCSVLLVSGTVSNSFRDCRHFFYMQTPPAGIRGTSLKTICQKYADKLRYATLYETSRHLPLYSAYIFKKSDGKRRADTPWMYEPQVEKVQQCVIYLKLLVKTFFVCFFYFS